MNCKHCKADCAFSGERQERDCKGYIPMTSADRIRAMSDEALTTFLNKIVVNHHIKNADNCNHCPLKGTTPCDTEGIIDWLKQPAEENDYGSCNSI